MEASRSQSPEYRTLVLHTSDLQLAVKHNLTPLGAELVSSTLITPDQYERIRNPLSPTDGSADLIQLIQTRVHQDPQNFHDFIRVLGGNLAQYGGILQKLHQTFRQQQRTDIDVTHGQSSVPPPSHNLGVKRAATEEEYTHKYPRVDQGSIGSVPSTPGDSQHQNSPPHSQPTAAAIHDPLLTSYANVTPPVTCGRDSNPGPMKGNRLMRQRPKLVAFYLQQAEVPEGAWPPVEKTQYINLALIRTKKKIDFSKDHLRQTIRGSVDDIINDKDSIKYDEVFTDIEDGARLLFEGRPGCGKTTMMNKVSQDWANGLIFVFSLLFLVQLRSFENRTNIELKDIIQSTTMDFSEEDIKHMCTYIEGDSGKGVVFILDGLDEYCPKMRKGTFIHQLIDKHRLPNSVVIVASRPAATHMYRRNATKRIEVLGFLKEQIHEYIKCYFAEQSGVADGLKAYLEHHPNIMHMCYLPLHVAMIAYLYEFEGDSLPQTETEIYRHFTLSTLQRSIRKRNGQDARAQSREYILDSFDDLPSQDKPILQDIFELAYKATVLSSQQVFSAKDVEKLISKQSSDTGNDESTLGLIVVNRYYVRNGHKEIYTFIHLTLQEFLAACYITGCSMDEQASIIAGYSRKKQLNVVWKFYCGMTQFSDDTMDVFKLLLSQTDEDTLLHIQCGHESQQEVTCSCVVHSSNGYIKLDKQTLNPADCTALAYVIMNSKNPTEELSLTSCNVGPEGFTAVVKEANDTHLPVKSLSFQGTKLRKGIEESLCALWGKCPSLTSLDISGCEIQLQTLKGIARHTPELPSLETLDLSSNKLGVKSGGAVLQFLGQFPSLKSVKLCWFDESLLRVLMKRGIIVRSTSEEFMKHLPSLIRETGLARQLQYFIDLRELTLSWKSIGPTDCERLAEGLQHCTKLEKLHLDGNHIGDDGVKALAKVLHHCSNIQELRLAWNSIGPVGCEHLAEGLQHCIKLERLDLDWNDIGDDGVKVLAKVLHHCSHLQELSLWSNSITDDSVGSISQLIRTAKQLKTLYLNWNMFTDDGKRALRTAVEERNTNPDFTHLNLQE